MRRVKSFDSTALIQEEKFRRFLENFESDLLRGIAKLCLLRIIKRHGEEGIYGYQILKELEQSTDSKLVIEEGTLYPMLKKLESWGTGTYKLELVHSTRKKVGGRTRKYYTISEDGLRIYNHLEGFFSSMIASISNLLDFQVIIDDKSVLYCPNCSNKILLDDDTISFCEICGLNIESIRDRRIVNE
jgi:PadR family transcriptional regulator PadR